MNYFKQTISWNTFILVVSIISVFSIISCEEEPDVINGCTDSAATNFNPDATNDDGSCQYVIVGCTDSTAANYNPDATTDDGSCQYGIVGCTDSTATNYNPNATINDGSCQYVIEGCTDSSSTNYNPDATVDDGSCVYANPPSPTPMIEAGYGTLSAVKSVVIQNIPGFGPVEIGIGVAVGVFFNGINYTSYVNAGSVSCEGSDLVINPNNSYTYTPTSTEPSGIDFSGNVNWEVGGNGNIPAFSYETNIGFPITGNITSGTIVTAANGYTLSAASVTGADSVLFIVGNVTVTEPGNATSHTFSASDLANVGSGASVVQVAAYRLESAMFSGKEIYFVNETVKSQSVTIQ